MTSSLKKRFTIEGEADGREIEDEILLSLSGRKLACAIVNFRTELRYKFKHRELTSEQVAILEEIIGLSNESFSEVSNCLEAVQ